MDREAKIKLIAEGAERAASEVRGVKDEVGGIAGAAQKAERALADVGKALYHMASDAAKVANDTKPISFAAAADSAKKFDDTVTRLATRSGKEIGGLKERFRDVGTQIGVVPQRVAEVTRALGRMTNSGEAVEAIKALGDEANDTDRSLEEVAELGATFYNKLGVPLDKVGDAIRRVRGVAADLKTAGGHIALEDTLVRLGPLLANFQGGLTRAAATVGVLGRGKSAEVGRETTGQILGTLEGLDPILLTRKLRQITGDKNYKPYAPDAQGRVVLKREVPALLQGHLRKLPQTASYQLFGRSRAGVQAAETFLRADLGEIPTEEARIELQEDAEADARARAERAAQHGANRHASGRLSELPGLSDLVSTSGGRASTFSGTAAGRRARTDVERENVSLTAGDYLQRQRDKRNNLYSGHRGTQAAVDTFKAYLPAKLERPLELLEAGVAEAHSRGATAKDPRITVDLSPNSIKGIATAVSSTPPVLRPTKSPAAAAVEDSKARSRAAANF